MAGSKYNFEPRIRSYNGDKKELPVLVTFAHPLMHGPREPERSRRGSGESTASKSSNKSKVDSNSKVKKEFIDPLGAFIDPLSSSMSSTVDDSPLDRIVSASLSQRLLGLDDTRNTNDKAASGVTLANTLQEGETLTEVEKEELLKMQAHELPGFVSWDVQKISILNKYNQTDKFNLVCPKSGLYDDVAKLRLELTNKPLKKSDLTQLEYMQQIKEAEDDLRQAWKEDKRVEALKIVIHVAGLLADTSAPHFYPSQFVLVTDLLDLFGCLVFERLWTKANSENRKLGKPQLSRYFDGDYVPELAKEIGRNWSYKVASIRELLPRFYAEASLLKCLRFCHSNPGPILVNQLRRLALTIRGIADPLVAAYAYCYLCRVAIQVNVQTKEHVWTCLHSWMFTWKNAINWHEFSNEKNVAVLHPPMAFILQCLVHNCTEEDLLPIWEWLKSPEKQALFITPLLDVFPSRYISSNCVELTKILLNSTNTSKQSVSFLSTWLCKFGKALLQHEPAPDIKRALVREVWKRLKKIEDISEYLECAQVWIEFACLNLGPRDINSLVEDIIIHVKPDKVYSSHLPALLSILRVLVQSVPHLSTLFSLDQFVQFLDLLQSDTVSLGAARCILESFSCKGGGSGDSGLCNHIVQLCRVIHDSLNALSLEDERRSSVSLICKSLDVLSNFEANIEEDTFATWNYVETAERELEFLVECRAAFSNLDEIVEYLVRRVHCLAVKLRNQFGGNISRRCASVMRSCVAYSYISAPSIADIFIRINLHIECAYIALINSCLPQADALFKTIISSIPQVPSIIYVNNKKISTEKTVFHLVSNLLSLLLVVPDPPNMETPLYLFGGLLNALKRYPWSSLSDTLPHVYCNILQYLASVYQPEYLYHLPSVMSNDKLYGSSDLFLNTIKDHANNVINLALQRIKYLAEEKQFRRQATVCLDLAQVLVNACDLSEPTMLLLIRNLCNLARKTNAFDKDKLNFIIEEVNKSVA